VEKWEERGVRVCLCARAMFVLCIWRSVSSSPGAHAHTRGRSPSSIRIDFVSVSLYRNFISVVSADGGAGCVCVLPLAGDEPFCLACFSPRHAAGVFLSITQKPRDVLNRREGHEIERKKQTLRRPGVLSYFTRHSF